MAYRPTWMLLAWFAATTASLQGRQSLDDEIARELPSLVTMYKALHTNPELSYFEKSTSAYVATELRKLGFDVTEHVGKYREEGLAAYGVVGVLKNGNGPVVLVRTDLDALPVEENTGLPYASKVKTVNELGIEVPVMHACGHDIHMTSFLGTARMLVRLRNRWHGTLIMLGQPSEERGSGARALLEGGLFSQYPKPNYALALHDNASLEAGKVGMCRGYALASSTSVDIIVHGVGGHGAYPHTTKDPVVIASEIVVALQTIVSRETNPLDPAVVTVGSIHGGTKHNVVPDEVKLQLTVRAYKEEVRKHILASIERIAKNIALAGGVPENLLPKVTVSETEFTPAAYNDPELTSRISLAFQQALGKDNVVTVDPVMGAEDFGVYGIEGKFPICMFWLGAVDPGKVALSKKEDLHLPSLHSSQFAPLPEPTIRTGVKAMTTGVMEIMK